MDRRLITLLFFLFSFQLAQAGGNSDLAKIKNIYYKATGQVVMEFEDLVQEKHFMPLFPKGIKKLRFDFKKWPKDSRYNTWWFKLSPWNDVEQTYKAADFENCINWMIENYKNGTSFQFGQVGGGKFEFAEDAPDEVVIPYLHFQKTDNSKEKVCYIDLG